MTRNRAAKFTIAFLACASLGAWAVAATPPPGLETPESALNPSLEPSADRPAVPVARDRVAAGKPDRAQTGNPLWGIPLRVLAATRERPLFSPSRRPPAPPAVAAPAPPPRPVVAAKPPPDHPLLTIVGTVVSETDGIGVFINQATNEVIRLHTGQEHDGWVLRSVQGREAKFERNDRSSVLALPAPGALPGLPAGPTLAGRGQPVLPVQPVQATLPVPAPAAASAAPVQAGNTWMDGDGNMITPPSAKLYQASGQAN